MVHSNVVFRALIYGLLSVLAFILLTYFSQPNRLAHDQIDHALVEMIREDPSLFVDDYLWGAPGRTALDNVYSLHLIEWFSDSVGGRELGRWMLVPIVFLFFTIGMVEACYALTRRWLVSLGIGLISNIHLVVFLAEWGLPGPTEVDPWAFVAMLYPAVFLLFYRGITQQREWLIVSSFVIVGLLGNLHLISAFNIVGVFALTYAFTRKWSVNSLFRLAGYVLLSMLCLMPFLFEYFSKLPHRVYAFDGDSSFAWDVIRATAGHVTFDGRLNKVQNWIASQWWLLIPGMILSIGMFTFGKKGFLDQEQQRFTRFGLTMVVATFSFNILFSLFQLARLYWFHQYPEFNEPRGIQLMYVVFFINAAIAIQWCLVWFRRKRIVIQSLNTAMALLLVACIGLGMVLYRPVQRYINAQTHMPFTFNTCDSEMFRVLARQLRPGDVVLVEPAFYSAIRVCLRYPIVVHSRDRATAYVHGSDMATEWYSRFQRVTDAFQVGGETLISTAEMYGARVIVSRQCVDVDQNALTQIIRVNNPTLGHEGCIYVLSSDRLTR